ncbi:hypothetical protein SAMN05216359_105304 [Roseateles sp. YR242]|nr:hypothetical protein SAMN05216359_105304 [Roseateles sp. YR242]
MSIPTPREPEDRFRFPVPAPAHAPALATTPPAPELVTLSPPCAHFARPLGGKPA